MIIARHVSNAAALCALLGMAACSSNSEEQANILATAGSELVNSVKNVGKNKGPAPIVQVTAEQLANTKVPAMQVNPEVRGGSDFLRLVTRRKDRNAGTVAVWRASDNAQIIVRGGVLVGSRGVGGDIISSDASATINAIAGARSGSGPRRYALSDGSYSDADVVLNCTISNLGPATTQVVNLTFSTVHLKESCTGVTQPGLRIENEYWVQPASGIVRRSRQWAGPLSGHFELILLKN